MGERTKVHGHGCSAVHRKAPNRVPVLNKICILFYIIIIIYEGHDKDRIYYMLRKIYLGKSIRYEVIMPYKQLNRDSDIFFIKLF
jgi:hypothetical protein